MKKRHKFGLDFVKKHPVSEGGAPLRAFDTMIWVGILVFQPGIWVKSFFPQVGLVWKQCSVTIVLLNIK